MCSPGILICKNIIFFFTTCTTCEGPQDKVRPSFCQNIKFYMKSSYCKVVKTETENFHFAETRALPELTVLGSLRSLG